MNKIKLLKFGIIVRIRVGARARPAGGGLDAECVVRQLRGTIIVGASKGKALGRHRAAAPIVCGL